MEPDALYGASHASVAEAWKQATQQGVIAKSLIRHRGIAVHSTMVLVCGARQLALAGEARSPKPVWRDGIGHGVMTS
jgi:hypothetical protein